MHNHGQRHPRSGSTFRCVHALFRLGHQAHPAAALSGSGLAQHLMVRVARYRGRTSCLEVLWHGLHGVSGRARPVTAPGLPRSWWCRSISRPPPDHIDQRKRRHDVQHHTGCIASMMPQSLALSGRGQRHDGSSRLCRLTRFWCAYEEDRDCGLPSSANPPRCIKPRRSRCRATAAAARQVIAGSTTVTTALAGHMEPQGRRTAGPERP